VVETNSSIFLEIYKQPVRFAVKLNTIAGYCHSAVKTRIFQGKGASTMTD
jgi:hypothetical protein